MSKGSKWRRYSASIGLMALTLAILLIFAELIFRANGKYATFNEKHGAPYHSVYDAGHKSWYHIYTPHQVASQDLKEYSYSIMANNEGLLDKDFVVAKRKRSVRIMVMGDSFVQGMGAGIDSTLPKLLEGVLRKQYGDALDIEVWNCGIGNSDPVFEYKLLADRLMKYSPDYVIDVINTTDISDVMLRGGFNRFKADSTVSYNPPPAIEPLYEHSFLVRRVMHDVLGYDWMFMRPAQEHEATMQSIKEIDDVLMRFRSLCATNKIPLLVAFLPRDKELLSANKYGLEGLIGFCDSVHIPHTDIRPCLQAKGFDGEKAKLLYWPIDGHCNGDGYRHFAECLSASLVPYFDSVADSKSK